MKPGRVTTREKRTGLTSAEFRALCGILVELLPAEALPLLDVRIRVLELRLLKRRRKAGGR